MSEDSLTSALKWKEVVEENCDLIEGQTIPIFLMQNKCDRLEELGEIKPFQSVDYLNDFAHKNKFLGAYQVSVKSDINVQESMDALLKAILGSSALRKTEIDNFAAPRRSERGSSPVTKSMKLSEQKSSAKGGSNSKEGCC